jgi:hypothetical protein
MEDQHGEKTGNEAEDRKFHELHCGLSCQPAVTGFRSVLE